MVVGAPRSSRTIADSVPGITAVLSAYNAERTIERVVLDLAAVLDGLVGERFEIVVVDDGSTDRTPQILTDLSLSRPRLHLITVSHQQARGTPTALAAGFDNARHELIFFSDAD